MAVTHYVIVKAYSEETAKKIKADIEQNPFLVGSVHIQEVPEMTTVDKIIERTAK